MTYDPSDAESVAEEEAFREGRQNFRAEAWNRMLRDPYGKVVLAEILTMTGFLEPSFAPGMADQTAYREGQRSIGIIVHNLIRWKSPETLADILKQMQGILLDGGRGGNDSSGDGGNS